MKNTIFKSFKFTFSLMLTVMLCLSFSTITNAASVKDIPVKKTISADITGDGKADKILITTTMDDDFRVKKLKVTVRKRLLVKIVLTAELIISPLNMPK